MLSLFGPTSPWMAKSTCDFFSPSSRLSWKYSGVEVLGSSVGISITVVTPPAAAARVALSKSSSRVDRKKPGMCECASTRPGSTYLPVASICWAPCIGSLAPATALMVPSLMPIRAGALPLGPMTVPPLMTRSNIDLVLGAPELVERARVALEAPLVELRQRGLEVRERAARRVARVVGLLQGRLGHLILQDDGLHVGELLVAQLREVRRGDRLLGVEIDAPRIERASRSRVEEGDGDERRLEHRHGRRHEGHEHHAAALLVGEAAEARQAACALDLEQVTVALGEAGHAHHLPVARLEGAELGLRGRHSVVIALVHIVGVIGLERVLVVQLPVPAEIMLLPDMAGHEPVDAVGLELGIDTLERRRERGGVLVEIDEHQPVEDLAAHLRQADLLTQLAERRRLAHRRCCDQLAVQPVAPVVIGADQAPRVAAARLVPVLGNTARQRMAAMLADRRQDTHGARLVTHQHQRFARHIEIEMVAGLGHLIGMRKAEPR